MSKKKWTTTISALLLVALLATGYLAIAAEYGSQEDPLVTLSYITDVLSPETVKNLEQTLTDRMKTITGEMDAKMEKYSADLDTKIGEIESKLSSASINQELVDQVADAVRAKMGGEAGSGEGTAAVSGSADSGWRVVKVQKGKTMMLQLGAEVVLRIGSGQCYSTGSTGLINLSNGTTLSNGSALSANNLYLVTIEPGRGVKATSDMTVLVSGGYTIE